MWLWASALSPGLSQATPRPPRPSAVLGKWAEVRVWRFPGWRNLVDPVMAGPAFPEVTACREVAHWSAWNDSSEMKGLRISSLRGAPAPNEVSLPDFVGGVPTLFSFVDKSFTYGMSSKSLLCVRHRVWGHNGEQSSRVPDLAKSTHSLRGDTHWSTASVSEN